MWDCILGYTPAVLIDNQIGDHLVAPGGQRGQFLCLSLGQRMNTPGLSVILAPCILTRQRDITQPCQILLMSSGT